MHPREHVCNRLITHERRMQPKLGEGRCGRISIPAASISKHSISQRYRNADTTHKLPNLYQECRSHLYCRRLVWTQGRKNQPCKVFWSPKSSSTTRNLHVVKTNVFNSHGHPWHTSHLCMQSLKRALAGHRDQPPRRCTCCSYNRQHTTRWDHNTKKNK